MHTAVYLITIYITHKISFLKHYQLLSAIYITHKVYNCCVTSAKSSQTSEVGLQTSVICSCRCSASCRLSTPCTILIDLIYINSYDKQRHYTNAAVGVLPAAADCPLQTVHCHIHHYVLYTIYYVLYTIYCILCAIYYILYTIHYSCRCSASCCRLSTVRSTRCMCEGGTCIEVRTRHIERDGLNIHQS
jgi:hypothetical protein